MEQRKSLPGSFGADKIVQRAVQGKRWFWGLFVFAGVALGLSASGNLHASPAWTLPLPLRLAPPQFRSDAIFFRKKTLVPLEFDMAHAQIHYAIDATANATSPVYAKPIEIRKSCRLSAVSTHPDYETSAPVERQYVQVAEKVRQFRLETQPNEHYPGNGSTVLQDLQKGSGNLHDGRWIGFLGDTVVITGDFTPKNKYKNLIISTVNDVNAWVLPMRKVNVWYKYNANSWKLVSRWEMYDQDEILREKASYSWIEYISLPAEKAMSFKIEIIPFGALPANHPGAGTPAWLFLDEVAFQ